MSLKETWVDKQNHVDKIMAEDVNSIANGVIECEKDIEKIEKNKLESSELTNAINSALEQAKNSGDFNGESITISNVELISNGTKVTFSDGNYIEIMNGEDGIDGKNGNGIKSAVLNADYTLTLTFDDGTKYTTPSIRGAAGKDGSNGTDGTNGVGIASIKQTTTSTADGGNNVFTVTLTNGTSTTFTIKNGSKGSKGDPGDDYVLTEADKQEIAGMAAVAPSIPSYWGTAVDNSITKAKAIQDMAGDDVVQFIHFSDMHYKSGGTNYTDNIGVVSRKLMDELHIPFIVGTGDITESSAASSSAQIDADVKDALATLDVVGLENLLYCKGNHDGAWGGSADYGVNYAMIQHPNKLWNRLYRWQAKDFRRVFSEDGSYYYVDNIPQKVRYIVMNSHWADYSDVTDADHNAQATAKNTQKNINYGDAQAEWLAKTALDFSGEDGWTVVVFTHAPLWNKYNGVQKGYMLAQYAGATCNASTIRDILIGFYNKSASVMYKSGGTVSFENIGENCTVAGVFCGHCHTDFMVKHDEYGNGTDIPFPIVSITSAGNNNSSYEQGFNMPVTTRTKDSATETAFDIVSINKKTKTINTVRMGAGSDRSSTYGTEEIIVTLLSISASYRGGSVPVGTSVNALTGITVTAHYSDGSTAPVTGYTLSGTIGEGNNTVTVSYEGKTATFTVVGEAEEEDNSVVTGVNVFDSTADGFMDDYRISSSAASTGYVTAASSKNQFVTNYIRVDKGMYVTIDVPGTVTQISTTIGGYYLVYDANKNLIGTYKNTGDGTLANNKYKVQINVSGVAYARFAPYKTSGSGITVANCNIVVTTA